MKTIHVKLPDKGVHVLMSEKGRQNLLFEELNIDNDELFPSRQPANDAFVCFVLTIKETVLSEFHRSF